MMFVRPDFKTKKALRSAIESGAEIIVVDINDRPIDVAPFSQNFVHGPRSKPKWQAVVVCGTHGQIIKLKQ